MHKKSILYYDSECKLCNTWLGLIRRFDKNKHIEYISLQSERGSKVFAQLNSVSLHPDTVVFEKSGVISIRSEAVLNCLSELGSFWTATKAFRILPLKSRDAVYDFIARNRFRWFGKMDKC
jgi:predicted DCC family thiol-disulfide oxidoreductase YuxK